SALADGGGGGGEEDGSRAPPRCWSSDMARHQKIRRRGLLGYSTASRGHRMRIRRRAGSKGAPSTSGAPPPNPRPRPFTMGAPPPTPRSRRLRWGLRGPDMRIDVIVNTTARLYASTPGVVGRLRARCAGEATLHETATLADLRAAAEAIAA